MILKSVEIKNFRNLKNISLSFSPSVNIILGKNAQGKTNLLEAIWLLSGNKSFRGAQDKELFNFDEQSFFIGAEFLQNDETTEFKIGCTNQNGKLKKKIFKNGKIYASQRALLGSVMMSVFSPDDLELIKSGPSVRRNYCDIILSSLFPSYYKTLSRYNRIVMQKNALLRDEASDEQIEIWNGQLSVYAASVTKSRAEFIKRLLPFAQKYFYEMTSMKEELTVFYQSTITEDIEKDENEIANEFLEKLNKNMFKEKAAGSCLYGPHRDEISININSKEARSFASQGQQRSAVLALLLAKTELMRQHSGKAPIVLLDDVMSELDEGRQKYLLEKINDFQVFITCCQDEIFKSKENQTFIVNGGEILKKE